MKRRRQQVVFTEETQRAAAAAASAGRSLWRVSSTVFSHCASDALLEPLGRFATPEALAAYPPTPAGEQVQAELEAINLKSSNGGSGGGRNSSGEPFKVAMA